MPEIDAKLLTVFQHQCPLSYKAVASRRYPLPRKYEGSYPNQDAGLDRRQLVLLIAALCPQEDSMPLRSELINLIQVLRCDCPTIYWILIWPRRCRVPDCRTILPPTTSSF